MSASKLVVRECAWTEVWPQGFELFRAHEQELKLDGPHAPIEINVDLCEKCANAGVLRIMGAFEQNETSPLDPRLVGYLFWYVSPSLISRHNIVADQGPWYVVPALRSTTLGYRLFTESMKMLSASGVKQVMTHRAIHSPPGVEKLIKHFGGRKIEEVWEIDL